MTARIVAAARTPIAARGGRLAAANVEDLAAAAIRALMTRPHLEGRSVCEVVLGNCLGPGGNTARVAALAAGLGIATPGLTIDRQCGSGLSAIDVGARLLAGHSLAGHSLAGHRLAGHSLAEHGLAGNGSDALAIAGGAESASTAPTRTTVTGQQYSRAPFTPAGWPDPDMPATAQALATLRGITRQRQEAFAARSHRLALAHPPLLAPTSGVERDDGPRRNIAQLLPRLSALFPDAPTTCALTAGTTSRINDGAAAVALAPDAGCALPGLRILSFATVGIDPTLPGLGPSAAVPLALQRAGITLADVSAFEVVEAFAAQTLAVLDDLDLASGDAIDPRVNAHGGALAVGHPWGASGAVVMVNLWQRLIEHAAPSGTIGVASAAIGGGMGVACVVEVVR